MKRLYLLCSALVVLSLNAQEPINMPIEDDMGIVEDRFQELFFEALKQKGIENYTKAIEALKQCEQMDANRSEIHFELGKNYKLSGQFIEAEQALKKAIALKPKDEWILDELYDVYFQQGATDKAMEVVKQLVDIHPDYKQDLATLYLKQQEFQKALQLLDELDKEFGPSEPRTAMRNEIYNATGDDNGRIENLKQRISSNPNNEDNYLNLIYRYSEQGKTQEAYATTKQLLEAIPESQLAHLALYKFAIENGDTEVAINSMKTVLNSTQVDAETKTKVLKDFMSFAKAHPEYQQELIKITSNISESNRSAKELGYYYLQNSEKAKALEQLSIALNESPNDYDILKNVILLSVEAEKYPEAAELSSKALEVFPAQPLLYLLNGVSNNRLSEPDKALESLEMGLDFIIDDTEMEIDYYKELSLAYKLKNNIKQSEAFAKKASALKQ